MRAGAIQVQSMYGRRIGLSIAILGDDTLKSLG